MPRLPGQAILDWELDDPALTDLDGVRVIRDDIRVHVETLIGEIAANAGTRA